MREINDLMNAIKEGREEDVRALVKEEPSLANAGDESGVSLLLHALYNRQQGCADAIAAKKDDFSVFEAAALGKADEFVAKITDKNVNDYSPDGFTALMLAAFFAREETVKAAIEKGANPNLEARNPSKLRAIHSAAAAGSESITAMLLNAQADPNAQQAGGYTPLMSAALHGNVTLAKVLIEASADPAIQADNGETARALAIRGGHENMVALLDNTPTDA